MFINTENSTEYTDYWKRSTRRLDTKIYITPRPPSQKGHFCIQVAIKLKSNIQYHLQ